jgi:hypothetical protein
LLTHREAKRLPRRTEMLAFMLIRGDNRMYVRYFFPRQRSGPILELKSDEGILFHQFLGYFNEVWELDDTIALA